MSTTRVTPNLELPQYDQNSKPTWLVDTNGAYSKIDTFAGETKVIGESNTQAIGALQTQANQSTSDIGTLQGKVALIESNQTTVNTHLNDVDAEIAALNSTTEQASEKAESALSTAQAAQAAAGNAASNAQSAQTAAQEAKGLAQAAQSTANTANSVAEEAGTAASEVDAKVPFAFGIDADGQYGYIKAGADTVTPFSSLPATFTCSFTYALKVRAINPSGGSDAEGITTFTFPSSVDIGGVTYTVTASNADMFVSSTTAYPNGENTSTRNVTLTFTKQ